MVQRRFKHAVYDLWCCNTQPTIYQYYDLGRIRTKINDELDRANPVRVNDPERAGVPTLRQDPTTGEYRTDR